MKLVVKSNPDCEPIELLLSASSHRIGRMSENDLSIQDDSVSRIHAEFTQTVEGDYTVNDLDSVNGTYLNGIRIYSPERLKAGDLLMIGNLEVAVEEQNENASVPNNGTSSGEASLRFISLEDDFSLSEEDEKNRNALAPAKAPRSGALTGKILAKSVKPAETDPESGETHDEEAESTKEVEQVDEETSKGSEQASQEELQSKIQSLTSALDDALEEISRLQEINSRPLPDPDDVDDQSGETVKLRQEIVQSQKDNATLRSEIIDLEDKLEVSERAQAEGAVELQKEADRNYKKNEELQAEIIELEDRLAESERNQTAGAAKREQESSQSYEDNEALRSEISDLKERLAESERNLAEETAKLEQETAQSHEDNETLRSEISDLKERLAESERNHAAGAAKLEQESAQSHESNEALQSEIIELRDRLAESERSQAEEAVELEQEIAQSHEDKEALRSEISELKNQLAESERRLLESNAENALVESDRISQLQEQIAENASASENLEKTTRILEEENLELQKQLEAAKAAGQKSAGSEADLRQVNADLVEKLKVAETNSAKLETQINKAASSITKNENLIEKLQEQLKDSESKVKEGRKLKTKLASTERKRLAAETKVGQLREKLASVEAETREIRTQLDTSEENCSELEEELARSMETRNEIESARDELKLQLNRRERSIAKLERLSGELEIQLKDTDKETAQILKELQLTREGLSDALHSTQQRLDDAEKNLNVEIYLREAVEKQLREAVANLENKPQGSEAVALSSEDTNLNRISHLTGESNEEEKSAEMLAFEARLAALYPSDNGGKRVEPKPAENGSSAMEEFYRKLLDKLDLVDSFAKPYQNKRRHAKIAQQFAQLKEAFLELLEEFSVSQFNLEPGTALGTHQKHRFDLAPKEDGTVPKIDPFGNTQVAETLDPGFVFLDGSHEVILRKAKVVVN